MNFKKLVASSLECVVSLIWLYKLGDTGGCMGFKLMTYQQVFSRIYG